MIQVVPYGTDEIIITMSRKSARLVGSALLGHVCTARCFGVGNDNLYMFENLAEELINITAKEVDND